MTANLSREMLDCEREHYSEPFETMWEKYFPQILADVRRHTQDYDDVQDLLQDIRITLYMAKDGYTGTGAVGAWVRGVCRRRCLQWERSRRRTQQKYDDYEELIPVLLELREDVEDDVEAADEEADLLQTQALQALWHLTPRQRQVVILRVFGERSITQIASELHCATGTVKATYHTALRRLRECL